MSIYKYSFLLTIFYLALTACKQKESTLAWDINLAQIGSQSSPRAADLNGDGILDIIIGAGKNEYQHTEQGVLAINGENGEIIWQQETNDQVFGSPTFYDITGDGTKDVFIGGRSPNFRALDGKTGAVIWQFDPGLYAEDSILQYARFNFYNTVLVPDQNQDGFDDLLAANGGNSKAQPNDTTQRFPGVLMLFDIKNGSILAADTMPDGKETYMSPLCYHQPGDEDLTIIFGTGGETINGNLYRTTLEDLKNKQLKKAIVLAKETGHGFIAPPVAVDITGDGLYDVVSISHGSTIFAINGNTNEIIWQQKVDSTESSNSLAVGYFNSDRVPDFYTFVSMGQWPNNRGSLQIMINGKNGEIEHIDSLGCTGFSSPVIYDLNHDGYDDAVISINEFNCRLGFVQQSTSEMENKLLVVDFKNKLVRPIDAKKRFKNIFSTPWIGDIDQDNYLDIVYCQYFNPTSDPLVFLGMNMKRISTGIKIDQPPVWGAYMGTNGNGIFPLSAMR